MFNKPVDKSVDNSEKGVGKPLNYPLRLWIAGVVLWINLSVGQSGG